MSRILRFLSAPLLCATVFCVLSPGTFSHSTAQAKEKKLPSGEAANELVNVSATVMDSDQLKEIFGSDFDKAYTVLEVTLTPKGGKPLDVKIDDFLLRSEQTGDHTGPLLAAQIGGEGSLVVKRGDPPKSKTGFGGGFGGIMMGGGAMGAPDTTDRSKVEMKESTEKDPLLSALKRKILVEKTISEPVTGLLFFPLDKEKPKHLVLVYTTPSGKLRMQFK